MGEVRRDILLLVGEIPERGEKIIHFLQREAPGAVTVVDPMGKEVDRWVSPPGLVDGIIWIGSEGERFAEFSRNVRNLDRSIPILALFTGRVPSLDPTLMEDPALTVLSWPEDLRRSEELRSWLARRKGVQGVLREKPSQLAYTRQAGPPRFPELEQKLHSSLFKNAPQVDWKEILKTLGEGLGLQAVYLIQERSRQKTSTRIAWIHPEWGAATQALEKFLTAKFPRERRSARTQGGVARLGEARKRMCLIGQPEVLSRLEGLESVGLYGWIGMPLWVEGDACVRVEGFAAWREPVYERSIKEFLHRIQGAFRAGYLLEEQQHQLTLVRKQAEQQKKEWSIFYRFARLLLDARSYEQILREAPKVLGQLGRVGVLAFAVKEEGRWHLLISSLWRLSETALQELRRRLEERLQQWTGLQVRMADVSVLGESGKGPLYFAKEIGAWIDWVEIPGNGEQPAGLLAIVHQPKEEGIEDSPAFKAARQAVVLALSRIWFQRHRQKTVIRELVNGVPEGILLVRWDGRIEASNRLAQDLLRKVGKVEKDYIRYLFGAPWAELIKEIEKTDTHHPQLRRQWENRIFDLELRILPKEGKGREDRAILILRDVTETELMRRRVEFQEKLASIGQMVSGIAHDFNNLLTPIIGYSDLLLDMEELPLGAREMIEVIRLQGQHAARLIRQLLDFSHRSVVVQIPIRFASFLQETVKLLVRTLPENIDVQLHCPPEAHTAFIEADPSQLQQMIFNLAFNAKEAMKEKGGRLRFELNIERYESIEKLPMADLKLGEYLVLRVSDTGCGIPPEILHRIFDPFFTTRLYDGGTGLGLSQVYGIVQAIGGEVQVQSKVGIGTTFIIYLPVIRHEPIPAQVKQSLEEEAAFCGSATILLVEDNKTVRHVIATLLRKMQCVVIEADDGMEGWQLYQEHAHQIDLIITDWVMPRMSGGELIRRIRTMDPMKPVLVLSAYPVGEDLEQLKALRIEKWLSKPVSLPELRRSIRRAFQQGQK